MDPNMPDRPQQQQQQQQPQHTVVLDDGAHASTSYSRVSPPKAVIDSSPLQSAMDKNKESLKVKLLVRRSFDQLVQQGIMPRECPGNVSITKAKPMKFHEYKGPPSAYKSSMSSSSSSSTPGHGASSDSNYQLIMQQQTLLSYLEDMCKQPAPAGGSMPSPSNREQQQGATDGEDIAGSDLTPLDSPLSNAGVSGGGGGGGSSSVSSTSRGGGTAPPITTTPLAVADLALDTLNKLKVSQLKKYCKQYNLAVSGTKSNLIERLKPFLKAIDPNAAGSPLNSSGPLSVSSATAAAGATVDQELEDSLLAEQQKRIAELQLQLKKSQEELEQFRSLCNNQFGAATGPTILPSEPTMVGGQMSPAPPPPPPLPTAQQLSAVLVGSQFSTTMPVGEPTETRGVDAPNIEPPDTTTMPVLEDSFFLEGLSAADSTTVDYGHDMEEILPPELTGGGATGTLPVPDRSPTHMATLDKVLGQVQPTISSIAMNAGDPNVGGERNNGVGSAVSSGSIRHGAAGVGCQRSSAEEVVPVVVGRWSVICTTYR
ncbi:AGAP001472-PA-like protein [Anopheles sinensis]|uniref:AGAP001472-PA-like protein n=1 Tax=Anopheles sinensis TaxID=74873 RepID=A0A084WNX9_ANOSI|nr:AGAP001472-PA-like protein [Anopheles sinensis]